MMFVLLESLRIINQRPDPFCVSGLDGIIKAIETALKTGDSVVLVGFGSFEVKQRAERTGRNPQTGQEITIAATTILTG
ncbi:MAG: DNA-binding protein HU [Gammaproteobacteria bacterium HGW-Gammaproteobacteria-3]|jgi:DNA-binding protein HU-beta|nr:MAG: DNA-binding protein HU [Gammaproteobacteria bacterium HGW-Gammaproteobacteria-3]